MSSNVILVEVGPRDGLQNEAIIIPTDIKIQFINQLSETGLKVIEVTSFVSPKWIPQLADHSEVLQKIKKYPDIDYPVLVPNKQGLENAIAAGVTSIAVFTTPSETFSLRNTHCTVAQSLEKIAEVTQLAKQHHIKIRGYVSCVLGCPYEGEIAPASVADIAEKLIALGCYQVSLGDTIGIGTPNKTAELLKIVKQNISADQLAVHFHDTYGQALTNIYVALENGIYTIDSSVAGLGGCPYAKDASGNVATEDVLYMLNGLGVKTGVDLDKMIHVGKFIMDHLGRESRSKVALAKANRV